MSPKYNPFYRTKPKMKYIPDHWGRLDQGEWVEDSNFSLPPKREFGDYLDARNLFRITASIGDRGTNDRTDVGKLEAMMHMAGVFDLDATDGPTGYYGERLKQAVKKFQKANALGIDGNVNPDGETIRTAAQHLQAMGRRGDTVLAHLTPEEARFLHENTDGGSINPHTGLMEFWEKEKTSSGVVQVDSYTQDRDGTQTGVRAHTRSAPGSGGGSKSVYRPPVANPKMRNDDEGYGHFGARRKGGKRFHNGTDIEVTPGETVKSHVSGAFHRITKPYGEESHLSGVEIKTDDGTYERVWYIDPKNFKPGQRIEAGETVLGTAQDARDHPGNGPKMKPHIHIDGRYEFDTDPKNHDNYYDLTPVLFPNH